MISLFAIVFFLAFLAGLILIVSNMGIDGSSEQTRVGFMLFIGSLVLLLIAAVFDLPLVPVIK